MENKFYLLLDKNILNILIGDSDLGEIELSDGTTINSTMPYLSGPILCGISTRFGLKITYNLEGRALSRWQYLQNLIKFCSEENNCSDLLNYLFKNELFIDKFKNMSQSKVEEAHQNVIKHVISKINGILYIENNELVNISNRWIIKDIDVQTPIDTEIINKIDVSYIQFMSTRAFEDIRNEYFDSAITKARTLLEEVFCYGIEKKNKLPNKNGDIGKLYKQVRDLYNMNTNKNIDRRVNTLLSGLNSIVSSIAEMRNKASDSHGLGSNRIYLDKFSASLFVNSAVIMSEFMLSIYEKNK